MIKLIVYIGDSDKPSLSLNAMTLTTEMLSIINECLETKTKFTLSYEDK